MAKNPETAPNIPEKDKSIIKDFTHKIAEAIKEKKSKNAKRRNEKAWERFPEWAKKEMLESLQQMDSVDLKEINIEEFKDKLAKSPSIDWWEYIRINEGEEKDSIWKYIIINWMKCREYQPWISWFTYSLTTNHDRYRGDSYTIEIMISEKWYAKKSRIIDLDDNLTVVNDY